MSEEILKALTQLFAIISKQDDGVSANERDYVIRFFQQELDQDSVKEYVELYDEYSGYSQSGTDEADKGKLTSVKDSVKTLGICRKINKTLTQKQKMIVLIKILEMVGSDGNFSAQKMAIINTVSTVFKVEGDEYKLIEAFVTSADISTVNFSDILVANAGEALSAQQHIHAHVEGQLLFMKVKSVDLYFTRYIGDDSNLLNGFIMQAKRIYLFSHGSTVKTPAGDALYYSDVVSHFNEEIRTARLSFNANIEEYKFQNGAIGLRNVLIAEGPGKLIGIMGASGAGKTTLLNVLAGLEAPSKGEILVNGTDVLKDKKKIQGAIGFVSQDDLLIEELTVYENLYYNAKLCFSSLTHEELNARVIKVLESLGLDQRKDLRVGNALEKTISGGQRKRLNIALELIREPSVLFLDEPTSGLSSRDSENVIDLLKELSLKGKLIFVVIHQPSSDIFKMFDKMIIMDTGGYPAYYGPPVEASTYFKKATHQVDSNRGQCEICGNVNPEQIFNIIEAKVVDEYGQATAKRKVSPTQWHDMYRDNFKISRLEDLKDATTQLLDLPGKLKQALIFATRDLKSKLANKQYLIINLFEAPLLALLLSFIIRYKSAPDGAGYSFRFNDNFPAYILMSIVVALFMGLTVSAEEIIKDRRLLKREQFLNLSWLSYLMSKVTILFSLSAVQTLLYVLVGNLMLGIEGMNMAFWLVLFTTSCFANVIGLNISSAFNSAVTVYVLIPILLIPQMVLSGLIFSFDKLNDLVSSRGKVPVIADMMASRWAYEALATHQFANNEYEQPFFEYDKNQSQADFNSSYLAEELTQLNESLSKTFGSSIDSVQRKANYDLSLVSHRLANEPLMSDPAFQELKKDLSEGQYSKKTYAAISEFIAAYKQQNQQVFRENAQLLEKKMAYYNKNGWSVNEYKNRFYNEKLADLVRNVGTADRIQEFEGNIIQAIDPIFQNPEPKSLLDYRTQFFVGSKTFLGITMSTYTFNTIVIWVMTLVLFTTLYFELLMKTITSFGKTRAKKTT